MEYEPFGPEWKKEMMKFKKAELVEMLKEKCLTEQKEQKRMLSILAFARAAREKL